MSRLIHLMAPGASALSGTVGDPEGTRTMTAIIALLVALGVALLMLAIWLWRSTRPDPELLAPLEAMGERRWRRADPVWQRRRLDELRPEDAEPLVHSAAPPDIDESFDAGPAATGFDDLDDVSLRAPDPPEPEIVGAPRRVVDADEPELDPPSGGRVGSWTPQHLDRPDRSDADPAADDAEDGEQGSNGDAPGSADAAGPTADEVVDAAPSDAGDDPAAPATTDGEEQRAS